MFYIGDHCSADTAIAVTAATAAANTPATTLKPATSTHKTNVIYKQIALTQPFLLI
jgi:hypothetical protein